MATMLDLTKNKYSSQWRAENAKDDGRGLVKEKYKDVIIESVDDDNTPDGSLKYTVRIGGPGGKFVGDYWESRSEAVSAAKREIDSKKK
jgi:hypothetical protein